MDVAFTQNKPPLAGIHLGATLPVMLLSYDEHQIAWLGFPSHGLARLIMTAIYTLVIGLSVVPLQRFASRDDWSVAALKASVLTLVMLACSWPWAPTLVTCSWAILGMIEWRSRDSQGAVR